MRTEDRSIATLEEIPAEECFELLSGKAVGRLGVSLGGGSPLIVPINYEVDGRHLWFRTGHGAKLRGAVARPVSFQVDEVDDATRTGWSVLVRGRAREVLSREAAHTGVEPWVPDGRPHWVRLEIRAISGRRIVRRNDTAAWAFDERGYL
jgi:uncharacterized protein